MPKRLLSGVVVSSNSNKTIVVKVTRRVRHKLYKKIISRSKKISTRSFINCYKLIKKIYKNRKFNGQT